MMVATQSGIRRIAIVGNGFEAWCTAGILAHTLDTERVEITVCAVAGSDAWDSVYSILPAHPADLIARLGIDDADLVSDLDGSFSLGARFVNGSHQGVLPYGPTGIDYAGSLFHHYWLRSANPHSADAYFEYSPAARALQQGRFAPPAPRNLIGPLQHEYARHAEIGNLTSFVRRIALQHGATESMAPFAAANRSTDGQRIDYIVVASGERMAADLYIDCSGPERVLLLPTREVEWHSADSCPKYELSVDAIRTTESPDPWHSVVGHDDGWVVTIPTQNQRIDVSLRNAQDGQFVPGFASQAWSKNCVGIGQAAACMLPIGPYPMLYLTDSIDRLVGLMPGSASIPAETLEYNNLSRRDLFEIRDLLAVHELARTQDRIDPKLLPDSISDTLRRRISLFAKRGWVPRTDSDAIAPHEWCAILLFYGVFPMQHDRLSERVNSDSLHQKLGELSARIGDVVDKFPSHAAYLIAMQQLRSNH